MSSAEVPEPSGRTTEQRAEATKKSPVFDTAFAASVALVAFSALRVGGLSGWHMPTALAVLQEIDVAQFALATFLSLLPVIAVPLAAGAFVLVRRTFRLGVAGRLVRDTMLLAAIFVTSFTVLAIGATVLLWVILRDRWALVKRIERVVLHDSTSENLSGFFAAAIVLLVVLSPAATVPPENIAIRGEVEVGRVIADDDGWVAYLSSDRRLLHARASEVTDRQLCEATDLPVMFRSLASVLSLPRGSYPPCEDA